jgi:Protein of unknown function (DUF1569)
MPRKLRCKTLGDIRDELARMERGPVETTGNWSYFQILAHLSKAVEGSLKGARREMPWRRRHVTGPLLYRLFALRGYIPAGIPGPPRERIEGDETAALAQYRKALEDFERHEGPFSDHPILGPLDKKQWAVFHALHFANHMGHARLKAG